MEGVGSILFSLFRKRNVRIGIRGVCLWFRGELVIASVLDGLGEKDNF